MSQEPKKIRKFLGKTKTEKPSGKGKEDIDEGLTGDEKRIEKSRENLNIIFILGIWSIFACLFGLLAIRALHLAWPVSWHYLEASQLDVIDKILIAAGSCTLVVNYYKSQIEKSS